MRYYQVDKLALTQNVRRLQEMAEGRTLWAVVKGDGYGLGIRNLVPVLAELGATHFAVTALAEARAIRELGLERAEILMMEGTCNPAELAELVKLDVVVSIGSHEALMQAETLGCPVRAHLKVDVGMGRFGFSAEDVAQVLEVYRKTERVSFEGIYTHFPEAWEEKPTRAMFEKFRRLVDSLRRSCIEPGMVHCCNSIAFFKYPEMRLDAVRLGSAILGRGSDARRAGLESLGVCLAELEQVKTIPKGHSVGYGREWTAKRDTRIAVLGVGYSNGFSLNRGLDVWNFKECLRGLARYVKAFLTKRALYVQVNGKSCRVLGHVGMVSMTIDVTDCPCKAGDIARVALEPLLVRNMDVIIE